MNEIRLRAYRLQRLREQLVASDYAAGVFFDPVNVRYATDSRNMQVWTLRNPARYVFVAADGPVVMFEFSGCEHLVARLETINEIRPATSWFYFTAGPQMMHRAKKWAGEIADLVSAHGGGNRRLAVDRLNHQGFVALQALGIEVGDGQGIAERARAVKNEDEIACLRHALRICGEALDKVRECLAPGTTENEAWAALNHHNAANGGEYIETRLLTSGPRTNPWFQEAGDRPMEAGDLVAIDADMYGPKGYFADISRSFVCGDGAPTDAQRVLYAQAHAQVLHNMSILRPGMSFREFAEKSWHIPGRYEKNRYMSLIHGAGLAGEYPYVPYLVDFDHKGYDGEFEENMTICVESYLGAEDGHEGVKLEQMVWLSEAGPVSLSDYPFEEQFL